MDRITFTEGLIDVNAGKESFYFELGRIFLSQVLIRSLSSLLKKAQFLSELLEQISPGLMPIGTALSDSSVSL